LFAVAMPGFDHACRARGHIALAESVSIIGGAEDFGKASALVEVRGERSQGG
jgi:hypothetical protein